MANLTPQEFARGCLLRIVAQPGRYDQQTWQTVAATDVTEFGGNGTAAAECPTTGCVAGTAAMLAGDVGVVHEFDTTMRNNKRFYMINSVRTAEGRKVGIRSRGAELLALSEQDAAWLFDGYRKLPEVVCALIELSEGKPLSKTRQDDMTEGDIKRYMNYRVPPVVKRQSVPAQPAVPNRVHAAVPQD